MPSGAPCHGLLAEHVYFCKEWRRRVESPEVGKKIKAGKNTGGAKVGCAISEASGLTPATVGELGCDQQGRCAANPHTKRYRLMRAELVKVPLQATSLSWLP